MSKLVLGTVQLGLKYGITNTSGKPDKVEAYDIIKYAIENNVKEFDTASEYGDSEQLLSYASNFDTNIINCINTVSHNTPIMYNQRQSKVV